MAWENIEERLKQPFRCQVPHKRGVVWFPDSRLEINEWLTSIAQTDEELKELNIPRIRFLQNRWPIERLLQLEWEGFASRRTILAMYVGHQVYILFFDGFTYRPAGLLEPKDQPELYELVLARIFHDPLFVPTEPKRIIDRRPDLIPVSELDNLQHHHESLPHDQPLRPSKRGYLAKLLVGWVGNWIESPVLGFWHDESVIEEEDDDRKKVA
jgi:hypothetical protein